jgi:opacity protein-like surface antigen
MLRKLTAAAVAATAVMSSGAWAQPVTQDADSEITLTIDAVAELYAADAEMVDDGNGTDTFVGTVYLCAESNYAGNDVELSVADFTLDNGATGTISYTIAGAGSTAGVDTELDSITFKNKDECNNEAVNGDFELLLSANVTGAEQGDYSDTITFRLTAQ